LVANFSIGPIGPLALPNPPLARIGPLSPLKGAYPVQTPPDISDFLRDAEMSMVKEDWSDLLSEKITSEEQKEMRKHERTGWPLGSIAFIEQLKSSLISV